MTELEQSLEQSMELDGEKILQGLMNGDPLSIALAVVSGLILICAIIALFISIYLAIRYVKYNKKPNSLGLTGEYSARKILDMHGLNHIAVSCSGSIMFGNSYSHYFKKVRLRRRTWKKASVASLAMAAQKSALAVMDNEGDSAMKSRIRMTPIISFGPLAFIPLIIVGIVTDFIMYSNLGTFTIIFLILGTVFYLLSFIMSILVLKTEKMAQRKAMEILEKNGMATGDELRDMKKLFHLYNVEYVNNMIISLLELILNILRIVAIVQGNGSKSSN